MKIGTNNISCAIPIRWDPSGIPFLKFKSNYKNRRLLLLLRSNGLWVSTSTEEQTLEHGPWLGAGVSGYLRQ